MGNTYSNLTVRTADARKVLAVVAEAGCTAYVARVDRMCVVFAEEGAELGQRLSKTFRCATLAVSVHDDDVLTYELHERGTLVDDYEGTASSADGGDAAVLCRAFGATKRRCEVEQILHGDSGYVFQVHRHAELVDALGLPAAAVGFGYAYLADGERPPGVRSLLHAAATARTEPGIRSLPGLPALKPPGPRPKRAWTATQRAIVDLHAHYLAHAWSGGDVWYHRYRKLLPATHRGEVDALMFALTAYEVPAAEIQLRAERILDAVWDRLPDHLAVFADPELEADYDDEWPERLAAVRKLAAAPRRR